MTRSRFAQSRFVRPSRHGIPRFSALGVGISVVTLSEAVAALRAWIAQGRRGYVTVTGVHGVIEAQHDPTIRAIFDNADMVTPDGMPLVYLGRMRGFPLGRVYGPDLMLALMTMARDDKTRHFLYGGGDGVAELLRRKLEERLPGVTIAGTFTPPFRPLTPDEERHVADRINASKADIVWVGLGTPKQEYWMVRMRARLDAALLIGVGAAFDFHAGLKPQAPKVMQVLALEWLFRLMSEPRRLWRRYLYNNPRFLYYSVCESLGLKRFPAGRTTASDPAMPGDGSG